MDATKPFPWEPPQLNAVPLLAEDELTDREIAEQCGVHPTTIWHWKQHPEFAARVKEAREKIGDTALRYAIGRRARRISYLNDQLERCFRLRAARAASEEMKDVPGGDTGMMCVTYKVVGRTGQVIKEYRYDAALDKNILDIMKQAAIEAGQWTEKRDITAAEPVTLIRGVPEDQL